jgi:hypothetical protein
LVQVITKKLVREEDIPFDDVCTVDSLALAQMMMDQPSLSEGCLNNMPLKTGYYVKRALSEEDGSHLELSTRRPPVRTTNPLHTPLIAEDDDTFSTPAPKNPFQIPMKDHQEPSFRYGARLLHENQDDNIRTQRRPPVLCNLNMQILSGFIAVLGVAAIAIAFTALNAATFGIAGLVLAGIGSAATLAGVGLFARESFSKCNSTPPATEQSPTPF